MSLISKLGEKYIMPYGYFNGNEILSQKDGLNVKRASDRRMAIHSYRNHYCVINKSDGVSLPITVEEVRETFKNERESLTEDKIPFHQYAYNPKKLQKTLFLETLSVYDIETYPDEENDDCVPHSVGCCFVSKRFITKVHIDLTPDGIEKKADVFVGESDEHVDKMLNHLNWKKKSDIWDPYLRLDVLSLAFRYKRSSDKIHDKKEIGVKDCLITSSLW